MSTGRSLSAKPQVVKVLGHYTLTQDIIGRGKYGKVYRGFHNQTQQVVAVKVVQSSAVSMVEVREMQRLRGHPNILRLLDQQQNEKFLVLVLEYCDGGDLQQAIDGGKLKGNEALCKRLFRQLLSGLHAIHEKSMMHRDLKPANILLQGTDLSLAVLKIADLGMAKSQGEDMLESYAGTPIYMAPERLRREPYDFSAEVWAAGCILYEMIYGRRPYNPKGEVELLRMSMTPPPFPREPQTLSDECLDLLARMLQYKPENRISINEANTHPWFTTGVGLDPPAAVATPNSTPDPPGATATGSSVGTPVSAEPKQSVSVGTSPTPPTRSQGVGTPSTLPDQPKASFDSVPPFRLPEATASVPATYVDPLKPLPSRTKTAGNAKDTIPATATPPAATATNDGNTTSAFAGGAGASETTPRDNKDSSPPCHCIHSRTDSSDRPGSTLPETGNGSITSLSVTLDARAMTIIDHARVILPVAATEQDPAKAAVLYAYAALLLRDAHGDEPRILAAKSAAMARSFLPKIPPQTVTKSAPELLVAHAIRIGKDAATEEQFDNKYCGPQGEPIVEVYRRGKRILDCVLSIETAAGTLSTEEANSIRRLSQQFEFRIRACTG